MLPQVQCDQKTKDILGEDGITEVAASLWAKDCQSCGRPLGSRPPSLCIDDAGVYVTAALHHPACRTPGWNDDGAIYAAGGANLSWTSLSLLLPSWSGRKADPRPAMLLNPGLEMIVLEWERDGWRPGYASWFTSLGMVPPDWTVRSYRPLQGVSAWLADDLISVSVQSPPGWIYQAAATREVVARARLLGGVLLMVTHALDPGSLAGTPDRGKQSLRQLLDSGQFICGWVTASQQTAR